MLASNRKPNSLSELIGNTKALSEIKEWAGKWENGEMQKPLLIFGPTGVGKTAAAHALASEFGWEMLEFNASDTRDEERVKRLLSGAASSGTLFGTRRLVLIDDVDSMSGREDKGGVKAIAKIIENVRQPVILTALDNYNRKIQTLRSKCIAVKFNRIHTASVGKLLRKIAEEKGLGLTDDDIERIAKEAGGDLRAALNDLEGLNPNSFRDVQKSVFDVVRTILKTNKYSEARRAGFACDTDRDMLKLWVAQNIPAEYELPSDIAEAYHYVSRADVFDGRIRRHQYWGYLRYSGDLLTAGTALAKTKEYHKYTPLAFPAYIRQMGSSKSARGMRKGILGKILRRCHCSKSQAAEYLPFIKESGKNEREGVTGYFEFDEDEAEFIFGREKKRKGKRTKKEGGDTEEREKGRAGKAKNEKDGNEGKGEPNAGNEPATEEGSNENVKEAMKKAEKEKTRQQTLG